MDKPIYELKKRLKQYPNDSYVIQCKNCRSVIGVMVGYINFEDSPDRWDKNDPVCLVCSGNSARFRDYKEVEKRGY